MPLPRQYYILKEPIKGSSAHQCHSRVTREALTRYSRGTREVLTRYSRGTREVLARYSRGTDLEELPDVCERHAGANLRADCARHEVELALHVLQQFSTFPPREHAALALWRLAARELLLRPLVVRERLLQVAELVVDGGDMIVAENALGLRWLKVALVDGERLLEERECLREVAAIELRHALGEEGRRDSQRLGHANARADGRLEGELELRGHNSSRRCACAPVSLLQVPRRLGGTQCKRSDAQILSKPERGRRRGHFLLFAFNYRRHTPDQATGDRYVLWFL